MPQEDAPIETPAAPYERQEGEPPKHFEWFSAFLEMGPSRSLLGAQKNFALASGKVWNNTDASPSWKAAARKWNWKTRAQNWDGVQREQRMVLIREREQKVIDRIFAGIETQLERVGLLDEFADFVLKFPRTRKTTLDGKTTIEPGDWNFDTGIRAFLAAGKSNANAVSLLELLGKLERSRGARDVASDAEAQLMEARMLLEAHGVIVGEIADAPELSASDRRALENARLDTLQGIAMAELREGVAGASEKLMRIGERRAKLNGLDMPTKIAQTDASGDNLPPWVEELLNASPDELLRRRTELDARRRAAMADAGEPAQSESGDEL